MNKKGSIGDMVYILVGLFTFAFISVLMFGVYLNYTAELEDNEAFNNTVNILVEEQAETTLTIFDYLYILFLLVMIVLVIVSSFAIRTHPIFFFMSILMLIITIVMGSIFSDVFTNSLGSEVMASGVQEYSVIPFIMNHLPTVILMIGAILIIVLYAKTKYEEN